MVYGRWLPQKNKQWIGFGPFLDLEFLWIFQKPTFFLYIWEVDREVNQPFIDYCSTAIINMPYFDGFYHKKMVNLGMVWRLFPVMFVGQENPHEYSRAASIMDHSSWSFFAPYLSFGAPLYSTFTGYLDILGLRGCASASARLFSPLVSGNRWKSNPSPVVAHTLRTTCVFGAILSPCIDAPSDVCWIITPWILQLWVS